MQHYFVGATFLLNHGHYEIGCNCGVITQWEFYTKTNVGDVYLQIWRPAGGNTYTLIGQTRYTVTGITGLQPECLPPTLNIY